MPSRTSIFRDNTQDTFLSEGSPTTNYGTGLYLSYGRTVSKTTYDTRIWLRQDIFGDTPVSGRKLEAGAIIESATLQLTSYSNTFSAGYAGSLRGLVEALASDSEATWNLPYTASARGWSGGSDAVVAEPIQAFEVPTGTGAWTIDITSLVQWAVDENGGDLHLLMQLDSVPTASNVMLIRSTDYALGDNDRPTITITWSPDPDDPPGDRAFGPLIGAPSRLTRLIGGKLI